MAGINNYREPSTAPQADRWYNLTLGSSFKDDGPSKFCTLRYDFKPASIDKNQRGTLHKAKDNKVTVEFQNIQPGKPKVTFEGTSEDYKDNDAVLFFDGESFRLERLHRAVKRLRHNRTLGEASGGGGGSSAAGHSSDANSPPVGGKATATKQHNLHLNKDSYHHHPVPIEVERIEIGDLKTSDAKPVAEDKTTVVDSKKDDDDHDQDEPLDIMNDDEDDFHDQFINAATAAPGIAKEHDFDINKQPNNQGDTDDNEIADIIATSDGEEPDKGIADAAEELRAQQNDDNPQGSGNGNGSTSSSSGSSGSDSSRSGSSTGSSSSGSGTSSSDSESSDAESA